MENKPGPLLITRRAALRSAGIGLVGLVAAACGFAKDGEREGAGADPETETDFSARFAGFSVADEPNGDLSKVVWPDYVTRAGPEVQRLYEFQIENGDLMKYMPCFCGCGAGGHQSNRDCYVRQVNPDGSVVFDDMAPT